MTGGALGGGGEGVGSGGRGVRGGGGRRGAGGMGPRNAVTIITYTCYFPFTFFSCIFVYVLRCYDIATYVTGGSRWQRDIRDDVIRNGV